MKARLGIRPTRFNPPPVDHVERPTPTPTIDGVPKETLERAIVKISESVQALRKSGLNERAIVTLLADSTKVSKRTIETVLEGLDGLRARYLR